MKIGTISSSSVHWDLGARAKFVPERIAGSGQDQFRRWQIPLFPIGVHAVLDCGVQIHALPTAVGDRSVAQARNDFVSIRAGAPVAPSTRYISQWWEPNR